jgi:hypothetical protein
VLEAMALHGLRAEVCDTYWLAKIFDGPYYVDVLFSLPNGIIDFGPEWFQRSHEVELFGCRSRLMGIEEMIASKVFVMRSDRFDGADICHLIRAVKGRLDWDRLLRLVPCHHILLWHLLLFNFVYPGHADYLPQELMIRLFDTICQGWTAAADPKIFNGMVIDPLRFAVDGEQWGYREKVPQRPLVDEQGKVQ